MFMVSRAGPSLRISTGFSFVIISLSPSQEFRFYRFRLHWNKVPLSSRVGCCSFNDPEVDTGASTFPLRLLAQVIEDPANNFMLHGLRLAFAQPLSAM